MVLMGLSIKGSVVDGWERNEGRSDEVCWWSNDSHLSFHILSIMKLCCKLFSPQAPPVLSFRSGLQIRIKPVVSQGAHRPHPKI